MMSHLNTDWQKVRLGVKEIKIPVLPVLKLESILLLLRVPDLLNAFPQSPKNRFF